MHNRFLVNICWKQKGEKREEIKKRKVRGRETERKWTSYSLYARKELALPQKKSERSRTSKITYFREIPNPISGGFAFLSEQILNMVMQGGDLAFLFCSEMCGDPGTETSVRGHWRRRIQLQQLQTEHRCHLPHQSLHLIPDSTRLVNFKIIGTWVLNCSTISSGP